MDRIGTAGGQGYHPVASSQGKAHHEDPCRESDRIELSGERCARVEADEALLEKAIARLPKVDIHRHLDGAIRPQTILRVAGKYGIPLPAHTAETLKPYVCVTDKDKTLTDFLKKFDIISQLFVTPEAVKDISRQCVLDAKEENIKAMELRFSPEIMAAPAGLDLREVMDAVIEGVREGEKETGIVVSLTSVIPRHGGVINAKMMEDLTEEYVKKGALQWEKESSGGLSAPSGFGKFTSLDLACDESKFPADPYAPVFAESAQEGIHRTLHAGEARGAESVRVALHECQAERIGHGVRVFEDPELTREIVEKGIPLEMCPTSNVQTGAVSSLAGHPLKKFYDMGGKATINTDDPAVCDTDLNKEYLKAIKDMGCSLRDVENMIVYAIDAMFLPPALKGILHREIVKEINLVNSRL
ncbi:MAG: adenosine deaminase family protein [Candidatus Eremiobacteraeota bacterium]|nr:adenosine deaminase family protein [Candidatus Eremiobacteraeota bacterium]